MRTLINPIGLVVAGAVLLWPRPGLADDASCLDCHKSFAPVVAGKAKQPIFCKDCHATLDGGVVPHRPADKSPLGLRDQGSASCLPCHDKPAYTKLRHGSPGAGCTGCHSAHDPKHGKLLGADVAAICATCHDRRGLQAKVIHKPVADGDCVDCHEVHATERAGLLSGEPAKPGDDCAGCHTRVKKGRHATASDLNDGHPVGGEKPGVPDPLRPEQPFQCVSCHDPHKSDARRLIRAEFSAGLCLRCHQK